MNRFAIGDIHGCSKTLKKLIEKIDLKKEDKLYLLGDLINKGPDSKGVIDYILKLQEQGYKVEAVRGNHDQKLLDVQKGNINGKWGTELQLKVTLESFSVSDPFSIPGKYLTFLASLPYYMELDCFFLVHAGFNFNTKDLFLDKPAMLDIKRYTPIPGKLHGKIILQGHIPTKFEITQAMVKQKAPVIKLDTGCVYYNAPGMGILTALDLDTFKLSTQENIDKPHCEGIYRFFNE